MFAARGWPDYSRTHIEAIGAESVYGPHTRVAGAREVIMRLTVTHANKEALDLFAREIAPAGTSWSPGTTGGNLGRPSPSPAIKQYAFLIDKSRVAPVVTLDGERIENAKAGMVADESAAGAIVVGLTAVDESAESEAASDAVEVPLIRIAHGRSGDKGDISNIGVIARAPALWPVLRSQLTAERVKAFLAHLVEGPVTRYELPGILALNFVCEQALDGGGMASLRNDPLGKGMAQILLSMPVCVPRKLLD